MDWRRLDCKGLAGLAVITVLLATAVVEWWWHGSPMIRSDNRMELMARYVALLLAALAAVVYDFVTMGPTVAIRSGVVAAIISWVLVVPLGMVSAVLMESFWCVLIAIGGFLGAFAAVEYLDKPYNVLAILGIIGASVWLIMHVALLLAHVLGLVTLFLLVYGLVRMGQDEVAAISEPVESWSGDWGHCEAASSEELAELRACFDAGCVEFKNKYDFSLEVRAAYKIVRDAESPATERLKRTANGQRLFHGTRRTGALGIVSDGFRLPDHHGMFGKGIYFAACPLKSWQYTDGRPWRSGLMLFCWVELGRSCHQQKAHNKLTAPPSRSFLDWIKGRAKYDSVIGDDMSSGGVLRVPEYVIYDPKKVEVDFILEVQRSS